MIAPISPSISPLTVEPLRNAAAPGNTTGFAGVLRSAIERVQTTGNDASAAVQGYLSGDGGELHSTVLATQKASLEFDMFLQVRNKVVQAYQEVMRMQL